jgi:hypothetical protein
MQEPPRSSLTSSRVASTSPNQSAGPPRTPEKQSRTDSSESSDGSDGSSQEMELPKHNADTRVSPSKITSRPAISSPLANSTAARHAAARVRSPLHRRRNTKGPSTPLARFVSHKIVAEKLASAKKAKPTPPSDSEGPSQNKASHSIGQPIAQTVPSRAPRSTTLTAPTSSSALRSTTKANERMISSQAVAAKASTMKRGPSPTDPAKPSIQPGTQTKKDSRFGGGAPRTAPISSLAREAPPTIRTVRKLEVGQAAGMGPRNASQAAPWR